MMAKRAGLALEKSDSLNEEGLPRLCIQCWETEVGRPLANGPRSAAMDAELQGQD